MQRRRQMTARQQYRVALRRVESDPYPALEDAFRLLDEVDTLERRGGALVTIKPNLTAPRASGSGVVSDVAVVAAFVRLLRKRVPALRRIVVADGPGMVDAHECFRVAGYEPLRDTYGVELVDLNRAPTRQVTVPGWLRYPALEIPEVVLDADLFVSITPVKTHTDGLYTLHAKNMFGVPPTRFYGSPRKAFHRAGVSEVVHDICRARPIDLAIIDGLAGTELGDPIDGQRTSWGAVAVGWNAQAVDVVGCAIMQVDPCESAYLHYLRAAGFGPLSLEEIEIVGDPLAQIALPHATPGAAHQPKSQRDSAH
jgi:uncharacterized protein (DUF362 family)